MKRVSMSFILALIYSFTFALVIGCKPAKKGVNEVAKEGRKKTVTLTSGEVILDISGEWDDYIVNYGPYSFAGSYSNILKIKQEGNSFVGIRIKDDPYHRMGSVAIRGELDKNGIKNIKIFSRQGPLDAMGRISEDGNRIIVDDGERARLTLTRR